MPSAVPKQTPHMKLENAYAGPVCGIDEAGRAPLAGPVVAGCVYIPPEYRGRKFWSRVRDSKLLSPEQRESLFEPIRAHSAYGIGMAGVGEIDALNIHHATLLAMKRACEAMVRDFGLKPEIALVDGKFPPALPCAVKTVIKGDNISRSVAAASILAKVTRDRLMMDLHAAFPRYGWERNAGYPTPEHLKCLKLYGVTIHHRRSFAPVRERIAEENRDPYPN